MPMATMAMGIRKRQVPSLSLPLFEDDGLPLGLQLVGFTDRDADVFSVASASMALFAD